MRYNLITSHAMCPYILGLDTLDKVNEKFFWVTPSLPSHQFFLGMRSWPQSSLSTLTGPTRRCTTILATFELHWLTRKDGKSGIKVMSLMKFRVSCTLEMKTIAKI